METRMVIVREYQDDEDGNAPDSQFQQMHFLICLVFLLRKSNPELRRIPRVQ